MIRVDFNKIKAKLLKLDAAFLFRRLLLGWLVAALIEYFMLPLEGRDIRDFIGLSQMSFPRVILISLLVTLVLYIIPNRFHSAALERELTVVAFASLCVTAYMATGKKDFMILCAILIAVFVIYALMGWNGTKQPIVKDAKNNKVFLCVTAGLAVGFMLFVSAWTVCRVLTFSTTTYDLGIFTQMFYYMKNSGQPMTTLERSELLSHFNVHISPIYYLLLPFYYLYPKAETLQVLQAAVLASAVIPLWKLGKHHGLSSLQNMLLCLVLLIYPAYSGGTSYDIHENAFLTPLLLWLFYGVAMRSTRVTVITGVLTLMVKEDAAVYVAVIGLWVLIEALLPEKKSKWGVTAGAAMLAVSIIWFTAAVTYLSVVGDGAMTYRYNNLMYDGSGSLISVIKAFILSPIKVIYECIDRDKLAYIGQTMLPLLFIPLLTRRYQRYILLIPYLLVNLVADYPYQHSIMFQYSFGTIACLIYLTAINLADLKIDRVRIAVLVLAVLVSASAFWQLVVPTARIYIDYYTAQSRYFEDVSNTLEMIPENASVASTAYYVPSLANREYIYDVTYCSREQLLSVDYVLLENHTQAHYSAYAVSGNDGLQNLIALLEESGYTVFCEYEGRFIVYSR